MFKRFVEIGRVALVAEGRDKGKLCVIVDVINQRSVSVCVSVKQGIYLLYIIGQCIWMGWCGYLTISPLAHAHSFEKKSVKRSHFRR